MAGVGALQVAAEAGFHLQAALFQDGAEQYRAGGKTGRGGAQRGQSVVGEQRVGRGADQAGRVEAELAPGCGIGLADAPEAVDDQQQAVHGVHHVGDEGAHPGLLGVAQFELAGFGAHFVDHRVHHAGDGQDLLLQGGVGLAQGFEFGAQERGFVGLHAHGGAHRAMMCAAAISTAAATATERPGAKAWMWPASTPTRRIAGTRSRAAGSSCSRLPTPAP